MLRKKKLHGYVCNKLIRMYGEDPTNLLLLSVTCLSLGRLLAMMTDSLVLVYTIMAIVIVCLGVMNIAIASSCSRLAKQDEVGGLFGIMESMGIMGDKGYTKEVERKYKASVKEI